MFRLLEDILTAFPHSLVFIFSLFVQAIVAVTNLFFFYLPTEQACSTLAINGSYKRIAGDFMATGNKCNLPMKREDG